MNKKDSAAAMLKRRMNVPRMAQRQRGLPEMLEVSGLGARAHSQV